MTRPLPAATAAAPAAPSTSPTESERPWPALARRAWVWLRAPELLLLSGPVVVAHVCTAGPALDPGRLLLAETATLLIGAHVVLGNAVWGERRWSGDRLVTDYRLDDRDWRPQAMALAGRLALLLGLLVLVTLSARAIAVGLAIAAVWTLYAHPRLLWKGRPGGDTAVHLVAGLLHAELGVVTAGGAVGSERPWLLLFLALPLVAGHLHHVVKDRDPDHAAGIRTIGSALGPRASVLAGSGVFLLAWLTLVPLARDLGLPPVWISLPASLHGLSLTVLRGRLLRGERRALILYRRTYRVLFVAVGMLLALAASSAVQ